MFANYPFYVQTHRPKFMEIILCLTESSGRPMNCGKWREWLGQRIVNTDHMIFHIRQIKRHCFASNWWNLVTNICSSLFQPLCVISALQLHDYCCINLPASPQRCSQRSSDLNHTTFSVAVYVTSNGMVTMNDTLQENLEGSDRGLIQVSSGPLSERAVKPPENPRQRFEPGTSWMYNTIC